MQHGRNQLHHHYWAQEMARRKKKTPKATAELRILDAEGDVMRSVQHALAQSELETLSAGGPSQLMHAHGIALMRQMCLQESAPVAESVPAEPVPEVGGPEDI